MGLDDSGGAGLKARMRVLSGTSQADARLLVKATVFGDGLVSLTVSSSLSSKLKPSNDRVGSSSEARPPMSKALAARERTVEPSERKVVLGRESNSILPVPTLQMASLAVRLGMKRSAALYAMRTLDLLFGRLVRDFGGVLEPVPVKVHSERPRSRRRGVLVDAMFDLGVSRAADFCAAYANFGVMWIDSGVGTCRTFGDGVRGMRPPAARVEKRRLLTEVGVQTSGVAIFPNYAFLYFVW